MNIRTVLLGACIGTFALGAASLPAKAEEGRHAAAAVGAVAGFAAGAAASQGGYGEEGYGPRRAYYGGPRYGREGGDGDGADWRRRRVWCSYHPGRC